MQNPVTFSPGGFQQAHRTARVVLVGLIRLNLRKLRGRTRGYERSLGRASRVEAARCPGAPALCRRCVANPERQPERAGVSETDSRSLMSAFALVSG